MRDLEKLECEGRCWLNVCGYVEVWKTVCDKCSGTKEDVSNINKVFKDADNKNIVLDRYDFNDEELKILHGLWF